MADDRGVQPCTECGWPALTGTRRCPYCRVYLARAGGFRRLAFRRTMHRSLRAPLRWLTLMWLLAIAPAVVLAGTMVGLLPAAALLLMASAPIAFLWALNRRSAARIRGLNSPAGHRTHTPGSANRPARRPRG